MVAAWAAESPAADAAGLPRARQRPAVPERARRSPTSTARRATARRSSRAARTTTWPPTPRRVRRRPAASGPRPRRTGWSRRRSIGLVRDARHRGLGEEGRRRRHALGLAVRLRHAGRRVRARLVAQVPPRQRELGRHPPRRDVAGQAVRGFVRAAARCRSGRRATICCAARPSPTRSSTSDDPITGGELRDGRSARRRAGAGARPGERSRSRCRRASASWRCARSTTRATSGGRSWSTARPRRRAGEPGAGGAVAMAAGMRAVAGRRRRRGRRRPARAARPRARAASRARGGCTSAASAGVKIGMSRDAAVRVAGPPGSRRRGR